MKKAELLQGIDLELPVEYHTQLDDGTPFVITGNTEAVIDIAMHDKPVRRRVAPKLARTAVTEQPEPVYEAPVYREPSVGRKVMEYVSDSQWRLFDKRYGTDIAGERKAQRVGRRILVARMAAGVDELPVWSKYKKALSEAERLV